MADTPGRDTERQAFERRRRQRNIAILVALVGFAVLIYVITLVKMGTGAG